MSSLSVSPRVFLFLPLLLLLLPKSSLQAEGSSCDDCEDPFNLEVVQSIETVSSAPATSVLILGEQDDWLDNGNYNYWLGAWGRTTGQWFTVKVDSYARWIAGVQIKNKGNDKYTPRATKGFKVSGAKNENGPWQTLLENELVEPTENTAAPLLNFTFEKPVEIQYLRFDLVSYWGNAGGLQYFAPILATTPECVLTLTPDPGSRNVVSTQLEGSWVVDDELTERLWPDFVWKSSNVTYKFENSSEVLDMIPEENCKFFHNTATESPIYMAGFFSYRKNEEPWTTFHMVLTTYRGNPTIVPWSYNSSTRVPESFNVMLARSSDESQDMLFVGGDINNQPFSAWKRL